MFNTEQNMMTKTAQGGFKVELFTPYHVKKEDFTTTNLTIPKIATHTPSLDVMAIDKHNLQNTSNLPDILPLKKSNITTYSPAYRKANKTSNLM